jgi:hypothetical protein
MGVEPTTLPLPIQAAYVRLFGEPSWALAPYAVEVGGADRRGFRAQLTVLLPGSNTPAIALLGLFTMVQFLDAMLTWTGIVKFGTGIEANPLLALSFAYLGTGATLGVAKLMAVACALVLHWRSYYLVLSVLTVLYVFGAIVPWTWTLGL